MATVDRVLPWRRHSAPPSLEIAPLIAAFREHHPKEPTTMITQAYELARDAHQGQTRKSGEPYVTHPVAVAKIVAELGLDDVTISAALLHDAVEDHPDMLAAPDGGDRTEAALTEAALAELGRRYNPRVADLVRAVTNPAHEPGRDRFEQYREHVAESLEANPWARIIKVSDFTDNGVGLIHTDPSRHVRLATKYAPLVPVFRDLIARPDTPLTDDVKQHILGQLDSAEERFDAILEAA